MAHIKMMAAAQPFISGAISKTVNLPHQASVEDIDQIYLEGWRLGLKAIAVYRDGSKMSQPLNSSNKKDDVVPRDEVDKIVAQAVDNALKQAQSAVGAGKRRRLPKKRHGFTVEARVGGHQVYLQNRRVWRQGCFRCEIFIDMHKEGATFRSLAKLFCQLAISLGLQYWGCR